MPTFDTTNLTWFEVTLTVSDAVVPLIVRMRKVGTRTRPPAVPERDPCPSRPLSRAAGLSWFRSWRDDYHSC